MTIASNETHNHLLKSLELISGNPLVQTHHKQIADAAKRWISKLKESGDQNWSFSLDPNWEIKITERNQDNKNTTILSKSQGEAYLLIGGEMVAKKGKICKNVLTVCIAIKNINQPKQNENLNIDSCCRKNAPDLKRVTRKFHFDYDINCGSRKIPSRHARSHLQFGGNLNSARCPSDYHYCLDHHIEIPRLHFPPYDLVMALDYFLKEFSTPINNLVKSGDWRSLVHKSEEIWLREYFNDIKKHFENSTDRRTLDECLCGV